MNRTIKLLSVVLVVQIALAVVVWGTRSSTTVASHEALIPEAKKATEIVLEDPEEGRLTLRQKDGEWFLEDDTKADSNRVKRLLDTLSELTESFPVARSDDARNRFKVAEDEFRRKVPLRRGEDALATLLVGSSPAMGESHIRLADADAIYRAELPVYELPPDRSSWQAPEPEPEPEQQAGPESAPEPEQETSATAPEAEQDGGSDNA